VSEPPEIDCMFPARSESVFTCHAVGMLKLAFVCEFHTIYFCAPRRRQ
jgi:hypothetical protein